MKKKQRDLLELIVLAIILFVLIIILAISAFQMKSKEKQENSNKTEQTELEENNGVIKEEDSSFVPEKTPTPTKTPTPEKTPTATNSPEATKNPTTPTSTVTPTVETPTVTSKESDVVTYFSLMDTDLTTYNEESNEGFREKAKKGFTTVVDFLFYKGEIKGYTFQELSLKTKIQVLKIAASMDNKIDTYFPNYKDSIKSGYQNIKGKIAGLYLQTTEKLCTEVGESACNEARNDFRTMKESFGYTWNTIKDAIGSGATSLKTILNEWYQSIK